MKIFDIDIFKLSSGDHTYHLELDGEFFEEYPFEDVESLKGTVDLRLEKNVNGITCQFDIDCEVGLICDRSLEDFDYPIKVSDQIVIKFGETEQEIGDGVFQVPARNHRVNVGQWVFELINVEIPMKKIHPDLPEEVEDPWVFETAPEEKEEEEKTIDPRWDKLKKLR